MAEQHRNAWSPREDAVWWPGTLQEQQQQQQQQAAAAVQLQQQQQQLQQQQQQLANAIARSTEAAAATHQLFSYKMASSFQNPATTGAPTSIGYDYRLATSMVNSPSSMLNAGLRPTDSSAPAANPQWWYPSAMDNNMLNMQNVASSPTSQHQNQQQSQSLQQQQLQQVQAQLQQQQAQQVLQHQQNQVQQSQLQLQHSLLQQQKGKMPRGKADARPRGRMTAYAFFVQTCREEHKKKHPDENVVFAEFSKKCAERWKTMSEKEKKRFHEMAEKDKKRYDAEMQNYTPPKGEKARGKKRKQIKDPNAPKRSLSAFFWFCNDERSKVKAINPEFGVGDIAKELGRRWSDVEPEVKSKYEAMAEKDKQRYDREMTAYKKRTKGNAGIPESVPEADDDENDDDGDE